MIRFEVMAASEAAATTQDDGFAIDASTWAILAAVGLFIILLLWWMWRTGGDEENDEPGKMQRAKRWLRRRGKPKAGTGLTEPSTSEPVDDVTESGEPTIEDDPID